jgi:Na+/H+ antiporter NhaD/arsenite permease-like protein
MSFPANVPDRFILTAVHFSYVYLPVAVLAFVFILIAVRQVGRFRLRIWQIMLAGAFIVLITGQISPEAALLSIDTEVMLFLFGMFVVGQALERSGYLSFVTSRLFSGAKTGDHVIIIILFGFGFFSAFLMNDTIAIIGTPIVLYLSEKFHFSPKAALLALCFAVTTGSVFSPLGNPQNFLVATYAGFSEPFLVFFIYLVIPALGALAAAYILLRCVYGKELLEKGSIEQIRTPIDPSLALLSKISLLIIVILITLRVFAGTGIIPFNIPLSWIALIAMVPLLLFSPERKEIIRHIDWCTLVFFAAMFVLMQSVFDSGFFEPAFNLPFLTTVPVLFTVSLIISQFISNVPFVALFQPVIVNSALSVPQVLALSAGSTLAGNLTLLGAASNIIVIQNAEKKGVTLSFMDFMKIGAPLTIIQSVIFIVFLSLAPA